jgi:dephospho-CoA kinase
MLVKKLQQRPGYNKKMVSMLRKIQLPIEEKKSRADFVLVNNYNKKTMQLRVKELLDRIIIND